MLLAGRQLLLGEDRLDRAFRLAQRAIDALVRVDHQEVRALVEAVHRADLHAVHVLALDAVFGNDERHANSSGTPDRLRPAGRTLCHAPPEGCSAAGRCGRARSGLRDREWWSLDARRRGPPGSAPGRTPCSGRRCPARGSPRASPASPRGSPGPAPKPACAAARGRTRAPGARRGRVTRASSEPISTSRQRFFLAFARRPLLQGLAVLHEARRHCPVAPARLDGAPADAGCAPRAPARSRRRFAGSDSGWCRRRRRRSAASGRRAEHAVRPGCRTRSRTSSPHCGRSDAAGASQRAARLISSLPDLIHAVPHAGASVRPGDSVLDRSKSEIPLAAGYAHVFARRLLDIVECLRNLNIHRAFARLTGYEGLVLE